MSDKARMIRSFFLGLILGGVLTYTGLHCYRHHWRHGYWGPHPEFGSKRILDKFTRELNLSAEQKSKVEKILESHMPKMKTLRDSVRPQFNALRESIQTEIRAVLRPDQLAKFDKIVQDFKMKRKEWEEKRDREIGQ